MERRFLYWLPRVLGIVFVLFISMFAMDVFGEYFGWTLLLALFMHLIPSLVLIGVLVLAWKKPFYGGIAYLLLGLIFTIFFKTYYQLITFLMLSLPLFLTGGLFLWEEKR